MTNCSHLTTTCAALVIVGEIRDMVPPAPVVHAFAAIEAAYPDKVREPIRCPETGMYVANCPCRSCYDGIHDEAVTRQCAPNPYEPARASTATDRQLAAREPSPCPVCGALDHGDCEHPIYFDELAESEARSGNTMTDEEPELYSFSPNMDESTLIRAINGDEPDPFLSALIDVFAPDDEPRGELATIGDSDLRLLKINRTA